MNPSGCFLPPSPCSSHTYKAYFYITCFTLCNMTLESKFTTVQATRLIKQNNTVLSEKYKPFDPPFQLNRTIISSSQ